MGRWHTLQGSMNEDSRRTKCCTLRIFGADLEPGFITFRAVIWHVRMIFLYLSFFFAGT